MALEEILGVRLEKLKKLEKTGADVFPSRVKRDFSIAEAIDSFLKISRSKKKVALLGRVFAVRGHGGAVFCDFKDGSLADGDLKPATFQAFLKKDVLGDEEFELFKETVDIGDFVEFRGTFFLTQKKEKSIKVSSWRMISKSLRPLPEKWHGLSDTEERFRKRYLDLLMNDEVKTRFLLRSKIVAEIRNFLSKEGFLEVETPMLQPIAGGALAEPFKTHHKSLDMDLFLRIAPELYLKKLLVAGFEKIFEIGRNFRNEGIDATHNPEFTMLEFYEAYADADAMRDHTEELVKNVAKKIFKSNSIIHDGQKIYFNKKFPTITFYEVLKRYALFTEPENANREEYKLKAMKFGIEVGGTDSLEKIADNIFKKICRPKLIQPVFVVDYPLALSPLAKRKEQPSTLTDKFQLIVGGIELVNGFSELNDPIDQKERFLKQQELRKAGDLEALEFDQSFVEALEYGMPPAGGVGIGIDRLIMLFLDIHNIKETILFPTMRPR